jgi:hypothetical protein
VKPVKGFFSPNFKVRNEPRYLGNPIRTTTRYWVSMLSTPFYRFLCGCVGLERPKQCQPYCRCQRKVVRGACSSDFWYRLRMEPTEKQFNALGNYRDIITQNAAKVAGALGISTETLTGWTEGNGEPTSEQAERILEFLRGENKAG